MFEHSSVSLARGIIILVGVVLLVSSVFHALLMWLAMVSLGVGISLLLAECLGSLFSERSPASFAVPPAAESKKES
jgi:hypothetical protein